MWLTSETAQDVEVMRLILGLVALLVTSGLGVDSWLSWRQHQNEHGGALALLSRALVWADGLAWLACLMFLTYVSAMLYLPQNHSSDPADVPSWVVAIVLTLLPLCMAATSLATAFGRWAVRVYYIGVEDGRAERRAIQQEVPA